MIEKRAIGPTRLTCRGLWKHYGQGTPQATLKENQRVDSRTHAHAAVRDVSFEVREGEVFVLMGLSGSGKSTTVRCLSRLVEPTKGTIVIDGHDVTRMSPRELMIFRRNTIGMVFQDFGLMPHLTVLDNVTFPLRIRGVDRRRRDERAREVIALVGLSGRELAFPDELSGGQQQRVGIARSLAIDPELLFLDEPFSALDPLIRRQMQDEFLRLERALRKTIVFVTHDFSEAMRVGDRIAIMKDGAIVQLGTAADLVLSPANSYIAEFTRDVPKLRCIQAQAIARPQVAAASITHKVPAETVLDELLPIFAAGIDSVSVVGESGADLGIIGRDAFFKKVAEHGSLSQSRSRSTEGVELANPA